MMDKEEKLRILAKKAEAQKARRALRAKKFKRQVKEEYCPPIPRRSGLSTIIGNLISCFLAGFRYIFVLLGIGLLVGAVYGVYHGYKWAYANYGSDELWWYVLLSAIVLNGIVGLIVMGWGGLIGGLGIGIAQAAIGFIGGPILFILIGAITTIFRLNAAVVTLVVYSIYLFIVPAFFLFVGLFDR